MVKEMDQILAQISIFLLLVATAFLLTIKFPNGIVNLRSRCESRLLVVYVGLSAEADVCQLTGREKVDL